MQLQTTAEHYHMALEYISWFWMQTYFYSIYFFAIHSTRTSS